MISQLWQSPCNKTRKTYPTNDVCKRQWSGTTLLSFSNPIIYPQIVFADRGEIISAGNFHGEYPAKALDYLAIGVHELASMSERRIERLVNPAYSELPAFLVKDGGLNSGFMIAHCTAAALGKNYDQNYRCCIMCFSKT